MLTSSLLCPHNNERSGTRIVRSKSQARILCAKIGKRMAVDMNAPVGLPAELAIDPRAVRHAVAALERLHERRLVVRAGRNPCCARQLSNRLVTPVHPARHEQPPRARSAPATGPNDSPRTPFLP